MLIKKYVAASMTEALLQIKEELGENAVILKHNKLGPDEIEVTAAIAEEAGERIWNCGADGDIVAAALNDYGVFAVDGTGKMADYGPDIAPWHEYQKFITDVFICEGVTHIGNMAFFNCVNLYYVRINNSVISIGEAAFGHCSSLREVTIPDSVTSIGYFAFSSCINLTYVTMPNSVIEIWNGAFSGCSSLTSVTIPYGVTSIGDETFFRCCGLTSVIIPNSVTSIGVEAFSKCNSLTFVTIPNSVIFIMDSAFAHCTSLTSVTIPDSVTYIECGAFEDCSNLTSVTIGNSVTSIGVSAFHDCSNLRTVISLNHTPPKLDDRMPWVAGFPDEIMKNACLYVPSGSIEAYRLADGWKDFGEIKEIMAE